MRILLALILGAALGAAALWYYTTAKGRTGVQTTGDRIENATREARESIQEKIRGFNLDTNQIKGELEKTGRIVREKAQQAGKAIADATADARTTATIKAKLIARKDIPGIHISVNTSDGVVTLSGIVSNPEDISKAMMLALEVPEVRQVISTIQVKPATSQ